MNHTDEHGHHARAQSKVARKMRAKVEHYGRAHNQGKITAREHDAFLEAVAKNRIKGERRGMKGRIIARGRKR